MEYNQLKSRINYSFVNKDKHMKKYIAANMECLTCSTSKYVDQSKLVNFHEFLRAYTDIFNNNILKTKKKSFKILKKLHYE